MARNDIVRRTQEAGWRSTSRVPDRVQKGWYDQDMDRLGRNKPSTFPKNHLHDQVETWGDFFSRPLALLVLAVLTFGLVFGILMWRDGRFELTFASGAKIVRQSKNWMQSAAAPKTAGAEDVAESSTGDLPPNDMEAMLDENRANEAALRAAKIAASVQPEPVEDVPVTRSD